MSFFEDVAGSLIDGVFDVGMGLFNDYRGRKNSQKAYHRQLYMSNTAHQREVKDLIAAGLNPILSTSGNGAATVSVPVAHSQMTKGSYAATYNSARTINKQNELMDAQIAREESATKVNDANAELVSSQNVAQKAQNIFELGKTEFFEGLPKKAKYDLVNAMLFPNSAVGQVRGLASSIVDALYETGKEIGNALTPSSINSTDDAILELIRDLRNTDAGSQGGSNSAGKVEQDNRNRAKLKELLEKRERESKEKDRKFFEKKMKGKVL